MTKCPYTAPTLVAAYRDGQRMFRQGRSHGANPYLIGSPHESLRKAWSRGFDYAAFDALDKQRGEEVAQEFRGLSNRAKARRTAQKLLGPRATIRTSKDRSTGEFTIRGVDALGDEHVGHGRSWPAAMTEFRVHVLETCGGHDEARQDRRVVVEQ